MVPAEENTRFCQRSATPGWRASSNAKTQRPRPKDANRAPFGWLRNTNIVRSRNAYTIERQYIRAIRPFLLVSNLGCRGVNRRDLRATGKTSRNFRGRIRNDGKRPLDES